MNPPPSSSAARAPSGARGRPECPRSELWGLWERYRAVVAQAERRDWLALELALSLLGNELKRLLDGAGREVRR